MSKQYDEIIAELDRITKLSSASRKEYRKWKSKDADAYRAEHKLPEDGWNDIYQLFTKASNDAYQALVTLTKRPDDTDQLLKTQDAINICVKALEYAEHYIKRKAKYLKDRSEALKQVAGNLKDNLTTYKKLADKALSYDPILPTQAPAPSVTEKTRLLGQQASAIFHKAQQLSGKTAQTFKHPDEKSPGCCCF